jgi:hypothetical protein
MAGTIGVTTAWAEDSSAAAPANSAKRIPAGSPVVTNTVPGDPLAAKRLELDRLQAQLATALAARRQRLETYGTTDPRIGRGIDRAKLKEAVRPSLTATNQNEEFPEITGVATWQVSKKFSGAKAVAFHPGGQLIAQSVYLPEQNNYGIEVIDLETGRSLGSAIAYDRNRGAQKDNDVSAEYVAWAPDAQAVYLQTLIRSRQSNRQSVIRRWRWKAQTLELEWELDSTSTYGSVPHWSPDGSRIITLNGTKLTVHDGVKGAALGTTSVSGSLEIRGWSRDGSRFLSCAGWRDFVVRDTATYGRPILSIAPQKDYQGPCFAVLSPDGKRLVVGGAGGRSIPDDSKLCRLLSVDNGATIATLSPPSLSTEHSAAEINNAVFSLDGRWLLTSFHNGSDDVWNGTNGVYVGQLARNDSTSAELRPLLLFADDADFALGCFRWNDQNAAVAIGRMIIPGSTWDRVLFHPASQRVYLYGSGSDALLLETRAAIRRREATAQAPDLGKPPPVQDDWRVTGIFEPTTLTIVREALALSGHRWLVLFSSYQWGYGSGSPISGLVVNAAGMVTRDLACTNLTMAAATTDGRLVAMGGQDGSATLYETGSWQPLWQRPPTKAAEPTDVQEIHFFSDDRFCLIVDRLWARCLQVTDGKEMWRFARRADFPDLDLGARCTAQVAHDASWIALIDPENQFHLLNPLTGKSVRSWPAPHREKSSMSLTDDGTYALLNEVLLDTRTGLVVDKLPSNRPGCWPGKARLVLADLGARVAGSNVNYLKLPATFRDDRWRFTPDGRIAVSSTLLVDTATLGVLAAFNSDCRYDRKSAISADGRRVAVWGDNGSCWLWGRPP